MKPLEIVKRVGGSVAIALLFLYGWTLVVQFRLIDVIFVSTPVKIINDLLTILPQHITWEMAWDTYSEMLGGFAIGAAAGIGAGMALHYVRTLYQWLQPYILIFYSIPAIVFAPLFILFFGIGADSKIVLASWGVFFVFLINTMQALQNVDRTIVNAAVVMGAKRLDVFRKVTLPYIMPWMTAAMKLGMGFAFIGAVVGEFIGAPTWGGLGWYINYESGLFNSGLMFAGIAILAALIMVTTYILIYIERLLVRWDPSKR
ncbi:MAG TPA: ABC transporter permease [Nitrososphaerales archaeon]|nr:ABC transporter permease [Nitrososphaerales archaeon]